MSMYKSKEWLIEKYITEGLSTGAIAQIEKVDQKTIHKWLVRHEIPTRPRGHNYKQTLKIGSGSSNPFYGKKHTAESITKMSESSKGPSPWLNGPVNHWYGKSGPDSPTWKGGVTPERQAMYATDDWIEATRVVWQRDNATCQRCGKYKGNHRDLPYAVHHVVSFADSKELRTDPDNLILLCRPCHLWVHSNANTDNQFIKEIGND